MKIVVTPVRRTMLGYGSLLTHMREEATCDGVEHVDRVVGQLIRKVQAVVDSTSDGPNHVLDSIDDVSYDVRFKP